jgi:hypothetical protein
MMSIVTSQPEATVVIPWRPSPSRLAAYRRVREFWRLVNWPVVTADSDTEVFSLSQARNNGVRKAKTDVVVISDADTVPDIRNVIKAVGDPVGVCWPFTNYRILPADSVKTPFNELADVPYIMAWDGDGPNGVGGCLVATCDEWWRLGGQPPEFVGWGWEDTAFTCIVETLSEVRRVRGNIYAWEHNTDAEKYTGAKADSPGWDRDITRNEELFRPYKAAYGRAWLMREIIKERTGKDPLGDTPNLGDPALVGRYKP